MARKRTIHPGAPLDEAVASCSIAARHVWVLLPCHADKLGRLEDKPFDLKLKMLPTDAVDMDGLLAELAAPKDLAGRQLKPLIERYVGPDGRRYIQIPSFLRYQTPHHREAASVIPPPARQGPCKPEKVVPGPDLGEAQPGLFAASPSDPDRDPDRDPVTDPVEDPERADPPEDPRARAIPGDGDWPEQDGATVHQVVARYRPAQHSLLKPSGEGGTSPPAAPADDPCEAKGADSPAGGSSASPVSAGYARDPPEHRALRLVALFGRLRVEVARAHHQQAVTWHPGPKDLDKATDFVRRVELDLDAQRAVEPTMRVWLERAYDSGNPKQTEVNYAFGTWLSRFSALREDVKGLRARAGPRPYLCIQHVNGNNRGVQLEPNWESPACCECKRLRALKASQPTATADLFSPREPWPEKGPTTERQG